MGVSELLTAVYCPHYVTVTHIVNLTVMYGLDGSTDPGIVTVFSCKKPQNDRSPAGCSVIFLFSAEKTKYFDGQWSDFCSRGRWVERDLHNYRTRIAQHGWRSIVETSDLVHVGI